MTMWLYLCWQSSDRTETQSRSWQRVRFISEQSSTKSTVDLWLYNREIFHKSTVDTMKHTHSSCHTGTQVETTNWFANRRISLCLMKLMQKKLENEHLNTCFCNLKELKICLHAGSFFFDQMYAKSLQFKNFLHVQLCQELPSLVHKIFPSSVHKNCVTLHWSEQKGGAELSTSGTKRSC